MEAQADNLSNRFLTFRVDAQLYALRSEEVSEVIRVPAVARIPQAPPALLGLSNLRGAVLPVASLRKLLNKPEASAIASERAIVLDIGSPVALVVDSVETLETAAAEQIETRKNELAADGAEKLTGAFSIGAAKAVAKILNIKLLLESAFANRTRATRKGRSASSASGSHRADSAQSESKLIESKQTEVFVTFEVAGQEFALPLSVVQEVIPAPAMLTAVARVDSAVLGVISVRDSLLPVLSLRELLGFGAVHSPSAQPKEGREKVVVVKVADTHIGLMADRARAIVTADVDRVDPLPAVLTTRTGGESRIKAIYRSEDGRRLISILSPEHLFREDVMQRLGASPNIRPDIRKDNHAAQATAAESINRSESVFLVFRLGDDEFGLPIDTVVEVAQVPSQVTRVPKAPKFLEGVVNLRGDVLPVVDQRRRFDMPKLESNEGRKLVVVKTERHRAGLIVDGVSDVLRVFEDTIEPPPELTDATTRLVRGVVNLQKSNRMVLLLDPTEVLTRAEQSQLDSFEATNQKANA